MTELKKPAGVATMKPMFEDIAICEVCGTKDKWQHTGWNDDEGRYDFYACRGEYDSGDGHMISCDNQAKMDDQTPRKFDQLYHRQTGLVGSAVLKGCPTCGKSYPLTDYKITRDNGKVDDIPDCPKCFAKKIKEFEG